MLFVSVCWPTCNKEDSSISISNVSFLSDNFATKYGRHSSLHWAKSQETTGPNTTPSNTQVLNSVCWIDGFSQDSQEPFTLSILNTIPTILGMLSMLSTPIGLKCAIIIWRPLKASLLKMTTHFTTKLSTPSLPSFRSLLDCYTPWCLSSLKNSINNYQTSLNKERLLLLLPTLKTYLPMLVMLLKETLEMFWE